MRQAVRNIRAHKHIQNYITNLALRLKCDAFSYQDQIQSWTFAASGVQDFPTTTSLGRPTLDKSGLVSIPPVGPKANTPPACFRLTPSRPRTISSHVLAMAMMRMRPVGMTPFRAPISSPQFVTQALRRCVVLTVNTPISVNHVAFARFVLSGRTSLQHN